MQTKSEYREYFRKKRQEISDSQRIEFSKRVTDTLSKVFVNFCQKEKFSGYIALFAGTNEEPDLVRNLNFEFLQKKFPDQKFCFPRVYTDKKSGEEKMSFYEVQQESDLEKGRFGILEPKKSCRKISPEKIALFCIPAVAIDTAGNRIGMGGGFYDKYLSQLHTPEVSEKLSPLKVGVVFSCQLSENLFTEFSENFDIPVDIIITEKKMK